MITVRYANSRGVAKNNWLTSYHTFSFGEYYDQNHMRFKSLRVINEDYIGAGQGFMPHSHQNMEIMTYIISGELEHQDDMGNTSIIKSGEVQFMRAGTNVTHSEVNPSKSEETHLLQIWVIPKQKDLPPTYSQRFYSIADKKDKLCLLASGRDQLNCFNIAQDVLIYASILDKSSPKLDYPIAGSHESIWIQLVSGILTVNDITINAGDGVAVEHEDMLHLSSNSHAEFILFHFY